MQIDPRSEKIISIYKDISDDEIDLRPDFQRGEVWTVARKKLLIDSIFRGWHIPPIHLVRIDNEKTEVLDGQQRLTAIRDYINNKFPVDGSIEPYDEDIAKLDKKKYNQLSESEKRKFDRTLLTVYEITEYNHGEPGELFHRLNQSVKLTSAEQRNAFFGKVRDQIADLVKEMSNLGIDKSILGFSNSRMAYNDLLMRICFFLDEKSIRAVVTEKNLTSRYRSDKPFSALFTITVV